MRRKPDLRSLRDMLHFKRPHGSESERAFIDKFLMPLRPTVDHVGNLIIRIGDAPILWSSHTDSVHNTAGMQSIAIEDGMISLAKGSTSSCLGADDAAGVWLMHQMVLNQVPGLYVFHRGEEVGGIGSKYIASATPELLSGIQYAVALDRKGYSSIITHQFDRCCSDEFAASMAEALGAGGWEGDSGGIYTDTAEYTSLVPECTNLSVGYAHAHSPRETLDSWFLEDLLVSLCELNVETLVCKRDPTIIEEHTWSWRSSWREDLSHDNQFDYAVTDDLVSLVRQNPDFAADILEQFGYTAGLFRSELWNARFS